MNMCPTNKCKPPPELCLKGQVFFIYTNIQSLESVKDRISLLGGKVDPFLSRDVTAVLVEDNHLVGPQLLSPDLTIKSAYASNAAVVTTFPYSNSLCSIPSTSRGYNFIATNTSNSPYRVICYARQWGINVYGIGQFLTWIEPQVKTATRQKKKASENINLSGCFIKFESLLKHYRPCYKMFNNDPSRLLPLKNANILVKTETCNVILDKPVGSRQLHFSHMDTADRSTHQGKGINFPVKANDKKPQNNNKVKPKEESNYCECCKIHFSDLKQHIRSSRHQNFVSNEKNYEKVHNILKMLPTPQEFIEKLQNPSPSSESLLANGDASLCVPAASMPETDCSVPQNLQMRRDTSPSFIMPVELPIEKTNVFSVAPSVIKEEPIDLHVKRDCEINTEAKDKQEINLLVNFEQVDSCKKEDANIIQPKVEMQKDCIVENANVEEKQPGEIPGEVQCDDLNGDLLLDRTNTAALAQLCLNNFDSYWLDTVPCEMDDMVFDDIFDIDDGKSKLDDECLEPYVENFVTPDIAQTPGLVSVNSTPDVKVQPNETETVLTNNIIDVKDNIKTEAHNTQSTVTCKLEKDFEASLSPPNIAPSYHGSLIEGKKQIFSIASLCSDKVSIEATPSCSNAIPPNKQSEPLFSSESSDDENGNVLISNALHIITNSDSEAKVDKESGEENSIQGQSEQKYQPAENYSVSAVKPNKICDTAVMKNSQIDDQMNALQVNNKNSLLVHSSSIEEVKMDIDSCKEKDMCTDAADGRKEDVQSTEKSTKRNELVSNNVKVVSTFNKECYVSNRRSNSDLNPEMSVDSIVPYKKVCSEEMNVYKLNHLTDDVHSGKIKTDPESHKENTSCERKAWDISSNEIHKHNSTLVNGITDNAKRFKQSYEEMPASAPNLCSDEPMNLDTKDKYLIPKKKVSFYDKKTKQSSSERNFSCMKVVPCENKVDQTCYFTSVKKLISKEEKNPEWIKEHPVLVEKCYTNKRNIKKDILREKYPAYSVNPCQYSCKKEKYDNISSKALPVQSSVSELTVKLPHKKKSSKLRKLPPLWSVSVLPGSGVKLKFTCINPNKKDTLQSDHRG